MDCFRPASPLPPAVFIKGFYCLQQRSEAGTSNSPFSQPSPPWCSTDVHREAFVRSDCSSQQGGKRLTEFQFPTSNQAMSPFRNTLHVQTTPVTVPSRICLKTRTTLPSCQPSALKHSPQELLHFSPGTDPALGCPPFKGASGKNQLLSVHPHVFPTQTGAASGVSTHLIDGDGGSVGQVHLRRLFPLPRRSKGQRRAQGAVLARRTPLLHSWLDGKSLSLAREDSRKTQTCYKGNGALLEFNNSPAERLELDLWK